MMVQNAVFIGVVGRNAPVARSGGRCRLPLHQPLEHDHQQRTIFHNHDTATKWCVTRQKAEKPSEADGASAVHRGQQAAQRRIGLGRFRCVEIQARVDTEGRPPAFL